MTRTLRAVLIVGVLATAAGVLPAVAGPQAPRHRAVSRIHKLDEALRDALRRPPAPQQVIIRVKPGREEALKRALRSHGDLVAREHRELGALTAVVHGEDLEALANDDAVESVATDAIVSAHGPGRQVSRPKNRWVSPSPPRRPSNTTGKSSTKNPSADTFSARSADRRHNASVSAQARVESKEVVGLLRALQGLGPGQPRGRGVGVAIIDSGIEPSEDFYAHVSAFYDFTQNDAPDKLWDTREPYDDYGHGTFVASLIANQGKKDGKYQGVAPGVHLIGMKVLKADGTGRTSDVIEAINFAVRYRRELDVDVINLSLGHPVYESAKTDPLVQAVEHAVRHGIVVVVSAGNFGMDPKTHRVGYGGITVPGNAPSAVTVGAADTKQTIRRDDDAVAPFSSRGPTWIDGLAKPDVVAHGVGTLARAAHGATLYALYPQVLVRDRDDEGGAPAQPSEFARLSGTSMAAAVAAGVASLVLEANPHLTPNAVKAVLEYTATPLTQPNGEPYDALTQGTGEVNGAGAIELARAIDTRVPLGAQWAVLPEPSTLFGKQPAAWAQNIVWGNYRVGGTVLQSNSLAWDENIVWGTVGPRDEGDNIVWGSLADTEQAENIVWGTVLFEREGDNIVWGSFTRDGDNIVWGNTFSWDDNIVWGNSLFGYDAGDNIVWGSTYGWDGDGDNIVWGNLDDENIVWGNFCRAADGGCDNIVWGNDDGDNVVWGTAILVGRVR